MDQAEPPSHKFRLPSPSPLITKRQNLPLPHFLTPKGMLIPRELQPPPMYGPRGATIPPKFLNSYNKKISTNEDFDLTDSQKNFCDPGRTNFGVDVKDFKEREYWCEICDKNFESHVELKKHINQHVKCSIDGCNFIASPFLLGKHVEQQHCSGLFEKIKNLNTPEDIAKWREDRKRNFPTRSNIELRRKAQEARFKRGEKLHESKNRFERKRRENPVNRNKFDRPKKPRNRDFIGKKFQSTEVLNEKKESDQDEYLNGSLQMFKGTSSFTNYKRPSNKIPANPLLGLLGMYGSDEDSESEEENNIEEQQQPTHLKENNRDELIEDLTSSKLNEEVAETPNVNITDNKVEANVPEIFEETQVKESSNDEMPEECPFIKIKEDLTISNDSNGNKDPPRRNVTPSRRKNEKKLKPKKFLDYSKLRYTRQNTMLEKLLLPDIRHERNILLQCVRYVVENNFFGIGDSQS